MTEKPVMKTSTIVMAASEGNDLYETIIGVCNAMPGILAATIILIPENIPINGGIW